MNAVTTTRTCVVAFLSGLLVAGTQTNRISIIVWQIAVLETEKLMSVHSVLAIISLLRGLADGPQQSVLHFMPFLCSWTMQGKKWINCCNVF